MGSSRRTFLKQVGTGVVSLSALPPAFLTRAAVAADEQQNKQDQRVLVLVQLAGGNDGLNTVIPFGDDAYYKARPGIRIQQGAVLKLNDYLGLHPGMSGFKELYDQGQLSIIQGVGYPNPNRSHFRSTDIWHSARPDIQYTEDGWLGRALDHHVQRQPGGMPAMALGVERLPLALVSAKVNVPTVRDPQEFQLKLSGGSQIDQALRRRLVEQLASSSNPVSSDLDFLRQTAQTALSTSRKLEHANSAYQPAATYPATGLGEQLKTVARLITGELGIRIYFVSLGGFDTHSQQGPSHQNLLSELAGATKAFFEDLGEHKLADQVMLATYSEFGRRVDENGSLGTDHGAASQMFVVSGAGKAGLHGEHPSLTDLEQGDLKFHTDFRAVYATILDNWLNLPSEAVLSGKFEHLDFV